VPRSNCPQSWEYDKNKDARRQLKKQGLQILVAVERGDYPPQTFCRDTRPVHKQLFTGLTPKSCPYFAGNYRGDGRFLCLMDFEVIVQGDPLVGTKSKDVGVELRSFADAIAAAIQSLDNLLAPAAGTPMDPGVRAAGCAKLACDAFVGFLTVHPYVNGNGHAARTLLFVILRHYGYAPAQWTVDPRPPFPNYPEMIYQYRRGVTEPLLRFVLSCMSVIVPGPDPTTPQTTGALAP
jgi:fido (protein-threonine AMPylation protein)